MARDPRISAIRADELVGRATCSSLDECFTDDELSTLLDAANVHTVPGAVAWARESEAMWVEQGTNTWSGEESDAVRSETEARLAALRKEL